MTASLVEARPFASFGLGCFGIVAAIALAILFAITLILIPVSLVLTLAVSAAWLFGWAAIFLVVGNRFLVAADQRPQPLAAVVVGGVLFALLALIPLISIPIGLVGGSVALGAALGSRFGTRREQTDFFAFGRAPAPYQPPTRRRRSPQFRCRPKTRRRPILRGPMPSLDLFSAPARDWFQSAFAAPTEVQERGWLEVAAGRHTLMTAPTGSGKTLAAFFWCLDRLAAEPLPHADRRCRVLYVSPLKALTVDVERNLRAPLSGMAHAAERLGLPLPDISVGIRTGDTTSEERRHLNRRPPDILITTPESLFLLLTSQARRCFAASAG